MGLFGGSSSKSTASAAETGQQVEDKGLALSIAGSKFKKSNITINSTDLGTVDQSFDLADASLGLAGDSTRNALEFGAGAFQSAIDSANASRSESLEFGAGAFQSALDAVDRSAVRSDAASRTALTATREANSQALEFGAGAFQSALASVDGAFSKGADDVAGFAAVALDRVSESRESDFERLAQYMAVLVGMGIVAWYLRGSA